MTKWDLLLARAANLDPTNSAVQAAGQVLFGNYFATFMSELKQATRPPQIVIIGKTGSGKSTTLNAVFNPQPNLVVNHIEPATESFHLFSVSLGKRGSLQIVDCPGFGDGEKVDSENLAIYQSILAKSDIALWIIKADDRALGFDQVYARKVLPDHLSERLIVGINQVDKLSPGKWSEKYNLPSPTLKQSINKKVDFVARKFAEIGITPHSIVPYAAAKNYRLHALFRAMIEACPQERIPALVRHSQIRQFEAPSILASRHISTTATSDKISSNPHPDADEPEPT